MKLNNKIKEDARGCWLILSTILTAIILGGLLMFSVGTIGGVMFDIAIVLQNNMGKIMLSVGAMLLAIWIVKNYNKKEKGED